MRKWKKYVFWSIIVLILSYSIHYCLITPWYNYAYKHYSDNSDNKGFETSDDNTPKEEFSWGEIIMVVVVGPFFEEFCFRGLPLIIFILLFAEFKGEDEIILRVRSDTKPLILFFIGYLFLLKLLFIGEFEEKEDIHLKKRLLTKVFFIIGSGTVFSLLHLTNGGEYLLLPVIFEIAVIGMLYMWLTFKTKTVVCSSILHMVWNAIAYFS